MLGLYLQKPSGLFCSWLYSVLNELWCYTDKSCWNQKGEKQFINLQVRFTVHVTCHFRFGKNRGKWRWMNRKAQIRRAELPPVGNNCKAVFWSTPGIKWGAFYSSKFPAEGILVSASPVPNHGAKSSRWRDLALGPQFTWLWMSSLFGLHYFSLPGSEWVLCLASITSVYLALNEFSVWPPLPRFTWLWVSTFCGLYAQVYLPVNEYLLWSPLPQFTLFWMSTFCGLYAPIYLPVNEYPLWSPLPQFT